MSVNSAIDRGVDKAFASGAYSAIHSIVSKGYAKDKSRKELLVEMRRIEDLYPSIKKHYNPINK